MDLGWFLVMRLLCVYLDTTLNITVIYHILSLFNVPVKCIYINAHMHYCFIN